MNERDLFIAALQKDNTADRAAYLDEVCGEPALRRRLELLLEAHEKAGSFMENALELATSTGTSPPSPALLQPATASGTEDTETPGMRIGSYKLLQKIAEGGMGVVWMAQQEQPLRRIVALKVIKPGMDSAQMLARFEAERQALALMDHANIAKVFDAGATANGRPYFVMELVKGIPITQYCDARHLTPRERLELMVPVCQAVQHAHQKGIIHRDIKPSNVLVATYDGKPIPKVIDFGVAKAIGQQLTQRTLFTQFGGIVGTLDYMSPEQAEFNALDVDTRSDVYSLGVLLYELLTGTTPVTQQQLRQAAFLEALRLIREQDPPRPSLRLSSSESLASLSAQRNTQPKKLAGLVRGELDWIVMKALEKDRARRYETANGLARDLDRYLKDEAVEACPPSAHYRMGKFVRKHKKALFTVASFAVVLLATTGISLWQWSVASKNLAIAERNAECALQWTDLANKNAEAAKRNADVAHSVQEFLAKDLLGRAGVDANISADVKFLTLLDQAALKIDQRFVKQPLAEAHIRTIVGNAYLSMGHNLEAKKHLEKALELYRRELGERHDFTLFAMYDLGSLYIDWWGGSGDFAKAEDLFARILSQCPWGDDDPDKLNVMRMLSRTFVNRGKYDEAEAMIGKVLELDRRRNEGKEPMNVGTLNNLAYLHSARGEFAISEPILIELFERSKSKKDAHNVLTFANNLAGCYQSQKKFAQAESLCLEYLEPSRRMHGDGHPYVVRSMSKLAATYLAQKKYDQAEPLLRDALTACAKNKVDNWTRFYVQSMLGECLLHRKNHAEAEKLLLSAYEGLRARAQSMAMPYRHYVTEAGERIVRFHEVKGQEDQAEEWRRKLKKPSS